LLQLKLLRSHAVGVARAAVGTRRAAGAAAEGEPASASGYSALRAEVSDALLALHNRGVLRCSRAGSVGCFRDLAPLAHLACP
jgi:histidine ammonia-lyase